MVLFKSQEKKFESDLKTELCGKRLYLTESVQQLGVKIDTNFSQQYHFNGLSINIIRANAALGRIRKYVNH